MTNAPKEFFNEFQNHLNNEQDLREVIIIQFIYPINDVKNLLKI